MVPARKSAYAEAVASQLVPDFAGLLQQLRAEAGLTQEELAKTAGLSPRTVSDLERGIHRSARQNTVRLLADALVLTEPLRGLFAAAARGQHSAAPAQPTADAPSVPRELPADVGAFTGRSAELAWLDASMPVALRSAVNGPVVISAVSGSAGAGKTALALRWAHRAAEHFPDGQLYVNLRGYDLEQPVSAPEALAGFLRALGVASRDIPAQEAERAARETERKANDELRATVLIQTQRADAAVETAKLARELLEDIRGRAINAPASPS